MFSKMLFVMLLLVIIVGCGDETPVAPERNTPPTIDALILPQKVEAGAKVQLQVVKRDAENDNLTINWQVSEGSLDTANAIWTAPKRATTVEIVVFVSDRRHKPVSATRSVQVVVTEPPVQQGQQTLDPIPGGQNQTQPISTPTEPEPIGETTTKIFPGTALVAITPGLENISVNVDESINEVESKYGRGTLHEATGTLMFNVPRLGEFGVIPQNGRVAIIITVDERYKTAQDIGVGSTRADVRQAFGEPDDREPGADGKVDIYRVEGISFWYDNLWEVEAILIF